MGTATQKDTSRLESVTYVGPEATFATRAGATMYRLHCVNDQLGADLRYSAEPNNDERQRQHDNPQEIRGTTDGSKAFPVKCYVKGIKSADKLGPGVSVTTLSQFVVLSHAIGRGYAAAGCTITSATSATVFAVDAADTLRVGAMIEVEMVSGAFELAVIKGLSAFTGAATVTLETGLSATPSADGDVRVVRSYCLTERGTSTMVMERKYVQDSGFEYRMLGCRGAVSFEFGDFNKAFTWSWAPECSDYQRDAALTSPSFGSYAPADDDMDVPLTFLPVCWLDATIETASDAALRIEKFGLEIAGEWELTHNGANAHGVGGVIRTSGRPFAARIKLTFRADNAEHAVYLAKTLRAFMLRNTTDASTFAVYAPKLEYVNAMGVKPVAIGKRMAYEATFNCLTPTGRTGPGSPTAEEADFLYSPIVLGNG